jgi:hypothetical protein
MQSPSCQLIIAFVGFDVVARSQTIKEPINQRSGLTGRTDVPILGVISLQRIELAYI